MPDSHAIVLTLQRYTIFRGLTYLIYAGLWLYYMQGLLHSSTTDQYCRDVQPTLRTVLLVISWIKLVVSIVFVCFVLSNVLLKPSVEQFALLLAMVVILGIFLYQIQFLNAVEASNAKTGDCDEVETHKRKIALQHPAINATGFDIRKSVAGTLFEFATADSTIPLLVLLIHY